MSRSGSLVVSGKRPGAAVGRACREVGAARNHLPSRQHLSWTGPMDDEAILCPLAVTGTSTLGWLS